jgi:hypothetical protein
MLKVAETEMRQMGLPTREITHARKAEQRLKVLLQPVSSRRSYAPEVEERLRQVQDIWQNTISRSRPSIATGTTVSMAV